MLFNIIVLILFLAIAYFHYAQGLFSATLSAILCIFAALTAVGYHEMVAPFLVKALPDQADAIALLGIFTVGYAIPRLVLDNVVPGNVRFPLLVDKVGAAVMGVVAGLFASGIFALAAQTMPFGAAVGGFSRQDIADRPNVTVPGDVSPNGRAVDSMTSDELVGDRLGDPAHLEHLWVHPDEAVLAVTRMASDQGGALADDHPLEAVHPDYLLELFGQELGVPAGSKHLSVNTAKSAAVKVAGAYALAKLPVMYDAEVRDIRGQEPTPEVPAPSGDTALVAVRTVFTASPEAMDADSLLRMASGNVRLKLDSTDYFPAGTMVGGVILLKNRADDPMVLDMKKTTETVDFLFVVPADDLNIRTEGKEKKISFKPGSFLEVRRMAQADLSGMDVVSPPPQIPVESAADFAADSSLGGVIRKRGIGEEAMTRLTGMPAPESGKAPSGNSGASSNQKRNNSQDLLPDLPNHAMGL